MRYGYACISMQLSYPQKWGNQPKGIKPITTGRSMIRRTFDSKGHDYASELTLANCKDLDSIMDWNVGQGYDFFESLADLLRGNRNRVGRLKGLRGHQIPFGIGWSQGVYPRHSYYVSTALLMF